MTRTSTVRPSRSRGVPGRIFLGTRGIAAVLSGLLVTLALPKFSQSYLLWGGLVPLFWSLEGMGGWRAFRVGLIQGLAQNLTMLYWIVYVTHVYGKLPLVVGVGVLVLLAGYLSLYRGVWALAYTWGESRGYHPLWWAPALWVALEYGQTYIFTGFPWELLGYGLTPSPYLLQNADLVGVYGLSGLIVLVNAALYQAGKTWGEGRRGSALGTAGVAALIVAAALTYGYIRLQDINRRMAASPTLKVGVVQGNIDQGQKWDPENRKATIEKYRFLTRELQGDHPHLVIWPETAAPFLFLRNQLLSPLVVEVARENGVYLLFGSPAVEFRQGEEWFFNRAYLLSPQGEVAGQYDKAHLVPYGEYVPLRRWFSFIGKMVPMVGDFMEGPPGAVVSTPAAGVGNLICFESIFPDLSRAMATNGARLLVNLTNDAWFGRTSAPYQHLSMAVLRAVENRLPLARAANTGFSAFILPNGQLSWRSELFVPGARALELPLLEGGSFYSRHGDLLAWLGVGLAILGLLGGWTRRRR